MARVSVANHAKLSWLLLRGGLRQLAGRAQRPSAAALAVHAAQSRPAVDRAAGSAHRRRHPRQRNLLRPLRLRRQGRGLRRPLGLRNGAAVRGMGDGASRFQLAAPSARRRIRASPAPMRARWSTNGSRCRAPGIRSAGARTCCRGASSPGSARRPLVLQDADVALLPALPAQPGPPGPLSAPHRRRRAARRRAHAGRDRAELCGALHRRPGAPHQIGHRRG